MQTAMATIKKINSNRQYQYLFQNYFSIVIN